MSSKLLIAICGVVIALGLWQVLSSGLVSGSGSVKPSGFRVMNIETGYRYHVDIGRDFPGWPLECPDTDKATCYPAELCPNQACQTDDERTWVVLNSTLGKADDTICPKCGTQVTMFNMGAAEPAEPEAKSDSKKRAPRSRRGRRSRSGG